MKKYVKIIYGTGGEGSVVEQIKQSMPPSLLEKLDGQVEGDSPWMEFGFHHDWGFNNLQPALDAFKTFLQTHSPKAVILDREGVYFPSDVAFMWKFWWAIKADAEIAAMVPWHHIEWYHTPRNGQSMEQYETSVAFARETGWSTAPLWTDDPSKDAADRVRRGAKASGRSQPIICPFDGGLWKIPTSPNYFADQYNAVLSESPEIGVTEVVLRSESPYRVALTMAGKPGGVPQSELDDGYLDSMWATTEEAVDVFKGTA